MEPMDEQRVKAVTPGWEGTAVYHLLSRPRKVAGITKLPLLVEFAGNQYGRVGDQDYCDGSVESCQLGGGLGGGKDYLWVCLPCIALTPTGVGRNCPLWWGDVVETKRYCLATVRDLCARFGADPACIVLCGFSRGAIACNYLGLHDAEIGSIWRAFFCHSHYDGVRRWPYPGSDEAAARTRLGRLRGRPQWISHEGSVEETRAYLARTGVAAPFTFVALPFADHSAAWISQDSPALRQARAWLASVMAAAARSAQRH
jgi:hypothetical protein